MQHNIEQIAQIVHETNSAFCQTIGDFSQLPWAITAPDIKESARQGVRAIIDNPDTTPQQSHDIWMKNKIADGWVYGHVKDAKAKTHPALIPYDQLDENQRRKDALFIAVVKAMLQEV